MVAIVWFPLSVIGYARPDRTHAGDATFRRVYAHAEARAVSDAHWSWRKRHGGAFRPDLWFLARPTPDQPPVGYAFAHVGRDALDAPYRLEAAGVARDHRGDSEMARRLIVTVLQELAGRSPMGTVVTDADTSEPAWRRILQAVGFDPTDRTRRLERPPGGA